MTIASSGPVGHIFIGDQDLRVWNARVESGDGDQITIRGEIFEDDMQRLVEAVCAGRHVTAKAGAVTVEFTPTEYKRGDFSRPMVGSFAMIPIAPVEIKGERVAEVPLRRSCSNCGGQRHEKRVLTYGNMFMGSGAVMLSNVEGDDTDWPCPSYSDHQPLRAEVCQDCGRVELFMEIEEKEDGDGR